MELDTGFFPLYRQMIRSYYLAPELSARQLAAILKRLRVQDPGPGPGNHPMTKNREGGAHRDC